MFIYSEYFVFEDWQSKHKLQNTCEHKTVITYEYMYVIELIHVKIKIIEHALNKVRINGHHQFNWIYDRQWSPGQVCNC